MNGILNPVTLFSKLEHIWIIDSYIYKRLFSVQVVILGNYYNNKKFSLLFEVLSE